MISADRDDSADSAVSIYGRESAAAGERRNTELWHIPREFSPNRPLCGANLAGRFKRTKGIPNCSKCRNNASLRSVYSHYHPVLRALYLAQPIPAYAEKYIDHGTLYEADLVGDKNGRMVLTRRGQIVARDIVNPVGWLDTRSKLFHRRRPLELQTVCNIPLGVADTALDDFNALYDAQRKHGRTVYTCVRCVIYAEPRADVES